MNFFENKLRSTAAAFAAFVIGITAVSAYGQTYSKGEHKVSAREFCSNNGWKSDDKVSFNELRETTTASTGTLTVDAGKNGGISIKGEDRTDILIRSCVQTWGNSEGSAKNTAGQITIATGSSIKAEGPDDGKNWSVSFQISVPRGTNLDLNAINGGISISGTDSNATFETRNGGININSVSGNLKGKTINGGINVTLTGQTWKGSGLDLQTTNGGVKLNLPTNYAAQIETGTVNGGFKSNIPALNVTTEDVKGDGYYTRRPNKIVTSINGGGAPIKVITTNGGVNISTTDQ